MHAPNVNECHYSLGTVGRESDAEQADSSSELARRADQDMLEPAGPVKIATAAPKIASEHDLNVITIGEKWCHDTSSDDVSGAYGQSGSLMPQMDYLKQHGISFPALPAAVGVQIYWHELLGVDVIEGTFTARMILSYHWYDSTFDTPLHAHQLNEQVSAIAASSTALIDILKVDVVSWPRLCFSNCLEMYQGESSQLRILDP